MKKIVYLIFLFIFIFLINSSLVNAGCDPPQPCNCCNIGREECESASGQRCAWSTCCPADCGFHGDDVWECLGEEWGCCSDIPPGGRQICNWPNYQVVCNEKISIKPDPCGVCDKSKEAIVSYQFLKPENCQVTVFEGEKVIFEIETSWMEDNYTVTKISNLTLDFGDGNREILTPNSRSGWASGFDKFRRGHIYNQEGVYQAKVINLTTFLKEKQPSICTISHTYESIGPIITVRVLKRGITPTLTNTPTPIRTPTSTLTPTLSPTPAITLTPFPRKDNWYQTLGGDVYSGKDLIVYLPEEEYFSLRGEGGFPGVVMTFNENPFFDQGKISEKEWLVTGFKDKRRYDYSYFDTLLDIPLEKTIELGLSSAVLEGEVVEGESIKNGVFWKIKGDLEVENLADNLGLKVFLIEGTVTFKNDLNLTNTLPVFITNGGMEILPQVHKIKGILISDGEIKTGEVKEDQTLEIEGMAISWLNFSLEREREDVSQPAEFFSYSPEMVLKVIPYLCRRSHLWEELVP